MKSITILAAVITGLALAAAPQHDAANYAQAVPDEPTSWAWGDADCDLAVNSIDVALMLQHDADLIASLDCWVSADVDGNREVDSTDALHALWFHAGTSPTAKARYELKEPMGFIYISSVPFLFLGEPRYLCALRPVPGPQICRPPRNANWPIYDCATPAKHWECVPRAEGYPAYSCSVSSAGSHCTTASGDWPDYTCVAADDHVECTTDSSDWADYSCATHPEFAFCTTEDPGFPEFACALLSGAFACGEYRVQR